jgi:hypothetical protein
MAKEYKTLYYREGKLASFMAGNKASGNAKLTQFLNGHAQGGWRMVTFDKWTREAFLVIMERDIP